MKYWFIEVKIVCGEYEFRSQSVHMTTSAETFDADKYVSDFYGDADDPDDTDGGSYYFDGGNLACSYSSCREISEADYTVLKRYM